MALLTLYIEIDLFLLVFVFLGVVVSKVEVKKPLPYVQVLVGLVAIVVLVIVVAFYFYRSVFSGGLSTNANDWSVFGTYIGGVLGPVISFVALVGLLVTADLQRNAFMLQKKQYEDLAKQQLDGAAAQSRQLEIATAALEHSRINSYKTMVLQMLQHRIDIHNQAAIGMDEKMQVLFREFLGKPELIDMGKISELAAARDENKRQARKLSGMVLTLALREHPSVTAFKADVAAALGPEEGKDL